MVRKLGTVTLFCLFGLMGLTSGCNPPPALPVAIDVSNNIDLPIRLNITVDGQASPVDLLPGQSTTISLDPCPGTVALVSLVVDPDGAATTTTFDGKPNSQLQQGTQYACGDRIVIEIESDPDQVNVRTE